MTEHRTRIDNRGRAYTGSQLQIQIYVNRHPEELSQIVLDALPSMASMNARLRWVSPLEIDNFAEYQDRAFLKAIGFDYLAGTLNKFWPSGGPTWDALVAVEFEGAGKSRGVVLLEAKSHPEEIYGTGCRASPRSRKKIEAALEQTKRWLGIQANVDWIGPLYQSANRLAHLYFFREIVNLPAWLANVYFLNDPHSPTSREEWLAALGEVKQELGLSHITVPYTVDVFLGAKHRRELFDRTATVK